MTIPGKPTSPLAAAPLAVVAAAFVWCIAGIVVIVFFDRRLSVIGRNDLSDLRWASLTYLPPVVCALVVGAALSLRRPRHPVGWLFIALACAIVAAGVVDEYATYGAVAKPGSLPGPDLAAVVGDLTFVPWLMLLGLIMLLTPSGYLTTRSLRICAWVTGICGLAGLGAGMLRPYQGVHADLGTIQNPIESSRLAGAVSVIGPVALLLLNLAVLFAAASLAVRYRNARDRERMQLRWLGWSAAPFSIFVIGAIIAATVGNEAVLAIMAGAFASVVPISAALAIEQYHLFNIEHLVSKGILWILLSTVLVTCYATVVVVAGESLGQFGGDSRIPTVLATLATVSLFGPARRILQDWLDRRFNRRRFNALAQIRQYLREPSPDTGVQQALRDAVGDETLTVTHWIEDRAQWVDTDGVPVSLAASALVLGRHATRISAVTFNPRQVDRDTVEAVAGEALSELENARLRAAISLQLVEVRESRTRIIEAQATERLKIERNLHDGAQQRLLALALQLRAAEVSRDQARVSHAIAEAVRQLQLAVQELRDLANGLAPAALSDSGLAGALNDLAARTPVPVLIQAIDRRYPAAIEETAWFVVCEAVANAVKHASPRSVVINVEHLNGHLRLVIADDGMGGADPTGRGLRGMGDRAEAIGGQMSVETQVGHGTTIIAELPCAS